VDTIYIATKNAHKVEEFAALLQSLPVSVLPLPDGVPDCPETGTTFESNAMQKASFYAAYCDSWVLADDSGLCVNWLRGAPGIHSARYAGVHGDSAANNEKLLRALDGVPESERNAQFVCVLALYHHGRGTGYVVRGEVRGRIASRPSGHSGFGYDPLFYVPELGCTYADLPIEVKNAVSHRARAVQALIRLWRGAEDEAVHR
jgi:XTP/dITP diphosphohydrolase